MEQPLREEFSELLKLEYGISTDDAGLDASDIDQFLEGNDTVKQAVEAYGNKYDLTPLEFFDLQQASNFMARFPFPR